MNRDRSLLQRRFHRAMKRLLDLALVLMSSPIWVPLVLVLAALVRLRLGPPVFFKQERPGYKSRIFTLYKFRTMSEEGGANGELLPDSERLTFFGRWLRATSVDELPELFNVIRGEMSLVGPRPLLPKYLDRYSPEQARRHEVLPGLTGLAQVNGRNALTWEEKFALDLWYVDHQTIRLDLKILALTFWRVVTQEGINAPGEVTVQEFGAPSRPADSLSRASNEFSSPGHCDRPSR